MIKDQGDEALYDKLDSVYPTDDDNEESEVCVYCLLDIHFLYVKQADLNSLLHSSVLFFRKKETRLILRCLEVQMLKKAELQMVTTRNQRSLFISSARSSHFIC